MRAMTWWDHETESIWSQPWGAAISGELKGETLTLLPSELKTWGSWISEHPNTRVLTDERQLDGFLNQPRRQRFNEDFVIGVAVGAEARGYYFRSMEKLTILNDSLGELPIAVFVEPETRSISVLLRDGIGNAPDPETIEPELLTFVRDETGSIVDEETGSEWDVERGLAISGPLAGTPIQRIPYTPAFNWAWKKFFPATEFWGDPRGTVPR